MKFSLALTVGAFASFASAQDLVDIPSTAIAAGSFTTLVEALGAAELVTALQADGPFTVFAPTDDAFAALPAGLVDCLLQPENSDVLTGILTYHVVSGSVLSTDLVDGATAPTLEGGDLTFDLTNGVVINGGPTVTQADVLASNGVIHIIDSVLVPPGTDVAGFLASCTATDPPVDEEEDADVGTIPEVAEGAGVFTTLLAAVGAASLGETLSGEGPFTVFAPTDDAFAALPAGLVDCLLLDDNSAALTDILTYHVVSGTVLSTDLSDGMSAATVQGEDITVDLSDGVMINMSAVTTADVNASNGVIHIIDAVLVPPSIDVDAFLATCPTDAPAPEAPEDSAAAFKVAGAIAAAAATVFAL